MNKKTPIAAMIDKRPMPDQQWQISITFTGDPQHWKSELDTHIQSIPEEQKSKMHLEAQIVAFLLKHDFAPLSRDFYIKK